MKARTILLIALAGLAVGYLVRGVGPDRDRATPPDAPSPERERAKPDDVARPTAPRPRFGAPADQPLYVQIGRDEFARWYRAHAPGLGLPEVADTSVLRTFAADVIDPLGRIPRPPILRALMAEYLALDKKNRAPDPELDAQDAAATRAFFDNLYRLIAYSDLLLLAHSARWECKDVPPPPTTERPPGGNPYAAPVTAALLKFERPFAPWYLAYRFELDLPERDTEFLNLFQWEVVQWLGRVPRPELLKSLVEAYTPLQQKWKQRTLADRDRAVIAFFDELRRRLSKTDYALLAKSDMWQDDCDRLKIPAD
ncbi:MAG: hypothetical protein ACYTG3_18595 [Planctomycetota bacterium]